jgi:cell division FtsZ-interacting protein ZapD
LTELRKENDRKMQDKKAMIERKILGVDQDIIKAVTKKDIAIVEADQKSNVMLTKAQGEKSIAENKVKATVVSIVN